MKSGTFNFWIARETTPDAFSPGTRCRWASFQIEGESCVVCSDGPTLAATLRMGTDDPVRLFRIPFSPTLTRRHLVTIGWSAGRMKVLLDSKLLAEVAVEFPDTSTENATSPSLPLLLLLAGLFPSLAHAHFGGSHTGGLVHGFSHPVSGLDHICAMIAVGLWAAQRGGLEVWLVSLTFVSVMAVGGFLGMAGLSVPFVEQGIVASVLVLSILIASAVRLPLAASVFIVGLFAIFHGHAHGVEMPQTALGYAYGAGFMLATALLHAVGILIAVLMNQIGQVRLVRLAGAAIALFAFYLWVV